MVTIIVTGHGNFATGMLSALKLIAGEKSHVFAVDFLEDYSTDDLGNAIKDKIQSAEKEVIILTDLLGGSPYNESVKLKTFLVADYKIEVLAGINFPILLSASLAANETSQELAKMLVEEGKDGIVQYVKKAHVEAETDDGI